MSITYDITTSGAAICSLMNLLRFEFADLITEYIRNCSSDTELFVERNKARLSCMDIHDIRYIAFHITGSLDAYGEIKQHGIRNLQYVLSHETTLSRLLENAGIHFDISRRTMIIDGKEYDVDYEHYRHCVPGNTMQEHLELIAHRIYYDYCINGFLQMTILKIMERAYTSGLNL